MESHGIPRKSRRKSTYLRNQNLVTRRDTHGNQLAILAHGTGADSEDLGLILLLDAALGEEDAGGGLSLGLDALDQDAVEEGREALDVAEDGLDVGNSVSRAGWFYGEVFGWADEIGRELSSSMAKQIGAREWRGGLTYHCDGR